VATAEGEKIAGIARLRANIAAIVSNARVYFDSSFHVVSVISSRGIKQVIRRIYETECYRPLELCQSINLQKKSGHGASQNWIWGTDSPCRFSKLISERRLEPVRRQEGKVFVGGFSGRIAVQRLK
jgi:hypothetical protein